MSVTLTNLRDLSYSIIGETEQDTSSYPYTIVDQMINSAQQKICNGLVINPLTKEITKCIKGLPFLKTSKFYQNAQSTTLSATTSEGATTLSVGSTTNFDSSGYLFINGNVVTYTGTTSTSFTGVTGVSFAFVSGTPVYKLFLLPTDYAKTIQLTYNNNRKIDYKDYELIQEEARHTNYTRDYAINDYGNTNINYSSYYSIINGTYIVVIGIQDTQYPLVLRYIKNPTTMSAITDTTTIDNDIYSKNTICYLAMGELLFNRGEEQRASQLINFGIGQVKEMYRYYEGKESENKNGIYPKGLFNTGYNF